MNRYEILAADRCGIGKGKLNLSKEKTEKNIYPIHLVGEGAYLTEEKLDFEPYRDCSSDLGWFYIDQEGYDYVKSHLEKVYVYDDEADGDYHFYDGDFYDSDDDNYPKSTPVEDITKEELDYFIKMMDEEDFDEEDLEYLKEIDKYDVYN